MATKTYNDEEKAILFQHPLKLELTNEQILLKLYKNKELYGLYNDMINQVNATKNTEKESKQKKKLVIDNIYTLKTGASYELDLNDFNHVKSNTKKLFENIFIDIDFDSFKWNFRLKNKKFDIVTQKFTRFKSDICTFFTLPMNLEDLFSLTPIEYLCEYMKITKPKMKRTIELYENYLLANDYDNLSFINRSNLIDAIIAVNFNFINSKHVEELLCFLNITGVNDFKLNDFLAICLFSERYFLEETISIISTKLNIDVNSICVYQMEQSVIENLDFNLIEHKLCSINNKQMKSKYLENLLLLISNQTKKLYQNHLKSDCYKNKSQKIYANEYREVNFIKINEII